MSASAERVVAFYDGSGTDHRGRTLAEILVWPRERLEAEHDFIQWLFPLRTPSPVNPAAPTLDDATIRAFLERLELRQAQREAFAVMSWFYGFEMAEMGSKVAILRPSRWQAIWHRWITPGNHNFLRITRILHSVTLLGQRELASAFLNELEAVYVKHAAVIGPASIRHWRNAVDR